MLVSDSVKMKWNSKNVKRYQEKGYQYTYMGDEFNVDIKDLPPYSQAKIDLICDYCGIKYTTTYYIWNKKTICNKDCCNNPKCTGAKAQESMFIKYGVNSASKLDFVKEKIKKTNFKKYGCENPFQNEKIKQKIRKTNIEKYGVPVPTQNEEIKQKGVQTCIEKYGVRNYGILYSATHKDELSPVWKGDKRITERTERYDERYREFRLGVFKRDNYTCQCCNVKNKKDLHKSIRLEAHHLNNFKDYIDERYDINNGITLCQDCHKKFHSIYGKVHTTKDQYYDFLNKVNNIDKKVC